MKTRPAFLLALLLLCARPAGAQQPCQPPPLPPSRDPNIFSAQQEQDLSDAVAEHIQRELKLIQDDELTAYLTRIGQRLLPHLPPSDLKYQFLLIDLPTPDAFSLSGRIYVTRKLVAFARSEDELAGILAHEMAHGATRQLGADMTRMFREILGVTQVSDRRDIFEKYHLLMENVMRKPGAFGESRKERQEEQLEADRVAVYALVGAGYPPEAFAQFFDRLAETKGKTGNWLTDFFETTNPEGRRLREMLKMSADIPAACRGTRTPTEEEFRRWQAAVVAYSGLGRKESLHGVKAKRTLAPPLRADLTHLRFSPDGRYLLAQDDASIFVLTREPLALLFRIDAEDAYPAQFSPDSAAVVFYTPGLRVERWRVADETREAVNEVVLPSGCLQTALAPDGKTLACVDWEFNLSLLDVASSTRLFPQKRFEPGSYWDVFFLRFLLLLEIEVRWVQMAFSPDARYFVAARHGSVFAADLTTRTPMSLPGGVKKYLHREFVFLGPDRLVGVNEDNPQKSAVIRFPTGEVLQPVPLGDQRLAAPGHGDYVLLLPIREFPIGVLDLAKGKVFYASKKPALDIYDQTLASEARDGQILLESTATQSAIASLNLPRSPLSALRTGALSPDLKWLAVSQRSRGAVWNLITGTRIFHTYGFRGAYFDDTGTLYADFPAREEGDKKIDRRILRLDTGRRSMTEAQTLERARTTQYGPYLVTFRPRKEGGSTAEDVIFEVRDVRNDAMLWWRGYPKESPDVYFRGRAAVLAWPVSSKAAKAEIAKEAALTARLQALREKEGDYYLEVVESATGNRLGQLLIETGKGSFRLRDLTAVGDWVVMEDNENRVLLYSLSRGELKGRFFGSRAALSAAAGRLCVQNERGQLTLYDLASGEKRDELTFATPVSFVAFTPDGAELFVLTADQTAYWIDLAAAAAASQAAARP